VANLLLHLTHKKEQSKTQTKTSIHDLGTKLEECVEIILKEGMRARFETECRKIIKGKSGVSHEIDVVARKDHILLAVEYKSARVTNVEKKFALTFQ
jgi:hypothetical protein